MHITITQSLNLVQKQFTQLWFKEYKYRVLFQLFHDAMSHMTLKVIETVKY